MTTSQTRQPAGQIAWTRDLARDLFPGVATPFGWTVLCTPAESALRRAFAELGAPAPDGIQLWQRDQDGQVCVNASALADAAHRLHGAAWLGSIRGEMPGGLIGRLQAGGVSRKAQACVDAALADTQDIHARTTKWWEWVRGLHWSQADLLQVMEELEPKARDVLQTYFILRAGLPQPRPR